MYEAKLYNSSNQAIYLDEGHPTSGDKYDNTTGTFNYITPRPMYSNDLITVCQSMGESRSIQSTILRREQLSAKDHI